MSKVPDIDHRQRERVVGQGRERFLAQPGNPQEDELPGLHIDLAIEGEQRDIRADPFVCHQRDRAEAHIDVVANMGLGAVAPRLQVAAEGLEVRADIVCGQSGERRAHPDHGCSCVEVSAHIVGAADAAAADNRAVRHRAYLAHAFQADGQNPLARHAAIAIAQHRVAVGRGVARANGVDGAQAVGAAVDRGQRNLRDVRCVGREFGNHRDIDHRFDSGGDLPHQVRVLAHRHAVATGVRAGQVQLEAVRYRREDLCHRHELLDAAAEDRRQQKAVRGNSQGRQHLPRCLCARIGQPHRIDEAARRVLAVHRFAISRARLAGRYSWW